MVNQKKKSAFFERLVDAFKSKTVRNLLVIAFLILSVFCMFLLDEGNAIRKEYLPGLSSNFIADILDTFNVERFNIGLEAWLIFFTIVAAVLMFVLASFLSDFFTLAIIEKKKDKFETEKKAHVFYKSMYYLAVLVIVAATVFIFFMAGAKEVMRPVDGIFLNLIYSILICLLFGVIGILVLCLLAVLVRGIVGFVSVFSTGIAINRPQKGDTNGGEGGDLAGSLSLGGSSKPVSGKDLFPSLTALDIANAGEKEETVVDDLTLNEFALRFQSYAANNHKIYYGMDLIRSFVAGMAASHLIILEGLSGTGKSMLPRMFSGFVQGNAFFAPVQATWRDKSDILGFYSEFTKTFKTTDFLRDLYSASYTDKTTMMVLDEMNISRIEYYFADFLSILEYPQEQWKVKAYEPELNQALPEKLTNGYVTIPSNTWFIGTANTDDSTFTITDKVYDRAITLDFRERIGKVTSDYDSNPINMTSERLQQLFIEAKENPEYCLSEAEEEKFLKISRFIRDKFDISFGNRIMVQIQQFVPVYVALGGTKERALDFMLTSKVLRKLEGLFEDYVKDELVSLTKLLNTTYGKGVFVESERLIAKILQRLV